MDLRDCIEKYFFMGFAYSEIVCLLAVEHNRAISVRTLKRILQKHGLFRRKHYSDDLDVQNVIRDEIITSGQLHGYRWMWLKCLQMGLVVKKERIRHLLHIMDPAGVELRRSRKLRRRRYNSKGPNFCWHIDGYDKLKPFGFCINGSIDGFSRKVIWLHVGKTNSDPKVISGYFLEAVSKLGAVPTVVRTDMGTENCDIADMQVFLRRHGTDAHVRTGRAFVYGTSQHNQRIESWWSILRKENAQFWINLFNDLKTNGYFCGDFLDKNLLQFCFMDIIQVSFRHTFAIIHCVAV